MSSLPLIKSEDQVMNLIQTRWKSQIDPLLDNEITNGRLIQGQPLSGTTVINHKLGRKMVGWYLVDIDGAVMIYRSTPLNDTTLTLTTSGPCTVSLWVF